MDLARELAVMCVGAMEKAAVDPSSIRDQFEQSELNEGLLHRHADRLKSLADERAAREDTSLGGYADTAVQRMLPIPKSMGEAAWRLPAIAAGGAAGHVMGKNISAADPLGIHRLSTVLDPAKVKALMSSETGHDSLYKAMQGRLNPTNPQTHAGIEGALKQVGSMDRDQIGSLFQRGPEFLRFGSKQHAGVVNPVKHELNTAFKGKGLDILREELHNQLQKSTGKIKPGLPAQVASHLDPYALGGTAAGVLGATALTGIPLAAKALWHKRHGGEDAVAARKAVQRAIAQANSEGSKREGLLGQLGGKEAALQTIFRSGNLPKQADWYTVPSRGLPIGGAVSHIPIGQKIRRVLPVKGRDAEQSLLRRLGERQTSALPHGYPAAVLSGGIDPQGLGSLMPGAHPPKQLEMASKGFNMMYGA